MLVLGSVNTVIKTYWYETNHIQIGASLRGSKLDPNPRICVPKPCSFLQRLWGVVLFVPFMFENLTPLTLSVDRGWEHPDFTGAGRVPLLKLILREIGRASWSYHSLLKRCATRAQKNIIPSVAVAKGLFSSMPLQSEFSRVTAALRRMSHCRIKQVADLHSSHHGYLFVKSWTSILYRSRWWFRLCVGNVYLKQFTGQFASNLQSLVRITDCALTVYCFWGWTD